MTKKTIHIETDIDNIDLNDIKIRQSDKRTRVVRKHTQSNDVIFNDSVSSFDIENESFIIEEAIHEKYNIHYSHDNTNNTDSDVYYQHLEMRKKIYELLKEKSDIIFPTIEDGDIEDNKKRKLPSQKKMNEYYKMLIDNLKDEYYTKLEIFICLSEYFTDVHYNSYKRLDKEYKNMIYNDLTDKYNIDELKDINFL